jgi:hypothetical protein
MWFTPLDLIESDGLREARTAHVREGRHAQILRFPRRNLHTSECALAVEGSLLFLRLTALAPLAGFPRTAPVRTGRRIARRRTT